MTVAIVLSNSKDCKLVHWASRIARGRQQGLVLLWARQRRGSTKRETSSVCGEIPEGLTDVSSQLEADGFRILQQGPVANERDAADEQPRLPLEIVSLTSPEVHVQVDKEVDTLGITSLIVPRSAEQKSGTEDAKLHDYLLEHVPCEIVVLTPGSENQGRCRRIVTPVGEGPHSASCLQMANDIVHVEDDARVVALHVEPAVDDVAEQAAESILARTVDRALGLSQSRIDKRVVLSDNVIDGIRQTVDESTDLIILGMKRVGVVRRFSSQGIADRLVNANPGPAIAVVQSAIPLSSRIGKGLERFLHQTVPQLPREQRISLVERIQSSSQWDFDFVLLICMSTLIAAGGLIMDSGAVVIGAMLVAPLMTPLLGTGLSITQGNLVQFQHTLMTVLKGFLLAFVIGIVVGAVFGGNDPTPQMLSRGQVGTLDILVGMVGGIAAAYASGRPNLLSALPGVAIAAALVPPIATSGIAFWMGEWPLASRAALLFFTNIVAIILGTWIAFRATGIRSAHEHGDYDRWTLGATAVLLGLVIVLGIYESNFPLTGRAESLMLTRMEKLADKDEWACTKVEYGRIQGEDVATVHLRAPHPFPAERLEMIRREFRAAHENPPRLILVTVTE